MAAQNSIYIAAKPKYYYRTFKIKLIDKVSIANALKIAKAFIDSYFRLATLRTI